MRLHLTLLTVIAAGCGSGSGSADFGVPLDMHVAAPEQLATASTLTTCLAVDADFVYWADYANNKATIQKVPIGGGAAVEVVAGGDKNGCVAVDANGIYYVEGDKIMGAPLAGGGAMPLATGQHVLRGPVGGGGYLYWITEVYGDVDAYNGKNAIVRLATTGGGSVQVVSAEVVGNPGALIVDDTSVYYSDTTVNAWFTFADPTMRHSFGQSMIHPNSLAVGAGHIAVAEVQAPGMGDVALFRADGMNRTVLSMTLAQPLAVDDKGVYIKSTGALERLALDGSGSTLLATQTPRALALSADRVYFTDGAAIYSLPR